MIKLKDLLIEQTKSDFSKEFFADLTAKGFTMTTPLDIHVLFSKANMTIQFEKTSADGYKLSEIYFPYKVHITSMGSDNISPDLAKIFIPYNTENKNVSDKPNVVDTINFSYWKAESMFGLHDLYLVTAGESKETTPIYKYFSDLIKLGDIATKFDTFNAAAPKDQLKIAAQDLKSLAKPGIDKAKAAAQNLLNRNKQTIAQQ